MVLKGIYKSSVKWKGEHCDVLHYNAIDFIHLPDSKIEKVYGICIKNEKLLLVYHGKHNVWGIPGGTREKDEDLLTTLQREIQEESACILTQAQPIAYQEVRHTDGTSYYILFYFCNLDVEGVFTHDVAGSVTKQEWVDLEDYHKYIEAKPFRHAVLESAIDFYKKKI